MDASSSMQTMVICDNAEPELTAEEYNTCVQMPGVDVMDLHGCNMMILPWCALSWLTRTFLTCVGSLTCQLVQA